MSLIALTCALGTAAAVSTPAPSSSPPDPTAPASSVDAPAPAPTETATSSEATPEQEVVRNGFSAKVESGFGYRRLFDHSIYGGTVALAAGAELAGVFAIHGHFEAFVGQTDFGLETRMYRFGPAVEAVFGRVRPGVSIQIAIVEVDRASNDGTMGSFAWAPTGSLSVDLVRSAHANLALIARGGAFVASDDVVLPSFGLALGGRFKVP